ncbi:PREDICTED: LOW QUALITY PROTEIN: probable cation-transporting ATPase 13A4, partial [Hipposideros armiger]|uniref:Cation-transporting ATPase n=1 Tax=Hipposideros armiger TaxID=186990 RepID=A0A8B7RZT4_HIPAR
MGDHFEKGQHALLNEGEENEMEMFGYRTHSCRKTLCLAGSVFSFGILPLVFYWRPAWHVWANCIPCSLQEADVVLLRTTDEFQTYSRKKITWIHLSALNSAFGLTPDHPLLADEEYIINRAIRKPDLKVRSIKVQKIRYVWNNLEGQFQKIGSLEDWLSSAKIHLKFGSGLTREEQEIRRLICGPNTIDVEITPIWKLLIKEQSVKLHGLVASHNSITVSVCGRQAGVQELESRFLVPGDLLILSGNKVQMPCDAVLIDGSCVVDEGMLTGFNTAKGDLVRSILYPKPMNFKLYRDAIRFLLCLVGTATIGMIYTLCVYVLSGEPPEEVVKKALDVITIAVPPALPAALTTGIIYAQRRLKKKGIFCISPQRINICGQLNLVCFDKLPGSPQLCLGQGFAMGPAVCCHDSCHSLVLLDETIQGDPLDLKMFEATTWEMAISGEDFHIKGVPAHAMIVKPCKTASQVPVEGIAILHQFPFSSALQRMTVIVQELGGDQLAFIKGAPEKVASFCQPETVPTSFVSELQIYTTQGFRVIAVAYKKLEMDNHTTALTRDKVESDLIFLGLLIFENQLKEETKPVLEELISARIRTVMITGDNLQTAITVARKSGMVSEDQKVILIETNETPGSSSASISWKLVEEKKHIAYGNQDNYINIWEEDSDNSREGSYHFALSGKSFQVINQHFSSLLPKILMNGTIFARMSPGQKSSLVEEFQKLDYFVGMCGDGANDCGALKMAHVGISLSEQEASVASPFTSKTPNIECVPHLIKEGRAALVTSFCMFKYMALYSMIQYVGVLLLYWEINSLSNYQFLFQDLAITTLIGVTSKPFLKLSSYTCFPQIFFACGNPVVPASI